MLLVCRLRSWRLERLLLWVRNLILCRIFFSRVFCIIFILSLILIICGYTCEGIIVGFYTGTEVSGGCVCCFCGEGPMMSSILTSFELFAFSGDLFYVAWGWSAILWGFSTTWIVGFGFYVQIFLICYYPISIQFDVVYGDWGSCGSHGNSEVLANVFEDWLTWDCSLAYIAGGILLAKTVSIGLMVGWNAGYIRGGFGWD